MPRLMLFAVMLGVTAPLSAEEPEPRPYIERGFVIVASTKTLSTAMQTAANVAEKTGIQLDLRGVGYHKGQLKESGDLTFSKKACQEDGWEYPCYVARGRFDSGVYVSVEYSSAYQGFAPGYYIVIAASGNASSAEMKKTLATVQRTVADAYIKTTEVYIGCMH